ncbi:MAG TPA: sulfurtransferase [Candidatus Angelobacter sp.]|nr:sulfurtransferase [Candidatus Angelobacter sp.]
MRRWTNFLFLLLAASCVFAQSQSSGASGLRRELLVTTEWLAAHLDDPDLVVLSVGAAPEFYAKGHIPGARQLLLSEIAVTRDGIPNELPPDAVLQKIFANAGVSNRSRIVLYGDRFNLFAARAYFTLDYLGLADHAALLDGGLDRWRAEQKPLSTDIPPVKTAVLTIAPQRELLVDTARMRELARTNTAALIDARPAKEFTGEQLSEDVQKRGHIPGARSLYWMDMLVSRENPVLKPEAELRRMYTEANASPGRLLVTYCRTGMQSSFDYFVAKYLGYEPGMYDGSFYEWSLKNLPAETSAPPK